MTCEEDDFLLVKSWLKCMTKHVEYFSNFSVVQQNYFEQVKRSFDEAMKIATDEGIADLNCAVFRLPFHLDYSKIIDFNRKILLQNWVF